MNGAILKSGQGWSLPALLGQLKTGQDGKVVAKSSAVPQQLCKVI